MKRLRFVVVPGQLVEPGNCYLMGAIPTVIPPVAGEPQLIGQRKLNMNMVPCRLEWVDTDEFGKETVHPIVLEDAGPKVVMPVAVPPTVPPTGELAG